MSGTRTRERPPAMALPSLPPSEIRALSKQVAREAGGSNVAAYFEANKGSLQKLLPAHMTPDRFLRVALNALRTTPKLMDCTLESLFGATVFAAQMGLEPNTPQGHIYLIPFKNNRKGVTEVQVIVGYQGLIALARRTGEIASISAQAVYAQDDYDIDYLNPENSRHKPKMNGPRGAFIGAWAKATFKDGGMAFDFMPKADIDAIRDGSQGYKTAERFNSKNSPWHTHYDQMAVKTAIRRLSKRMPMSIEMATAVELDERGERRGSQRFEKILDAGEFDLSIMAGGDDEGEEEGQADEGAQQGSGAGGDPQDPGPEAAEGSRMAGAEEDVGESRPADDAPERGEDPPPPADKPAAEKAKPAPAKAKQQQEEAPSGLKFE
jgi:recombination protein RecT